MQDDAILKACSAEGEATDLEFKAEFDPFSTGDWCELVKDVVAFANAGGGCIVFGVNDDGSPSDADLDKVRNVDPATVSDKVYKYTDQHFGALAFHSAVRQERDVVILRVHGAAMPIVFCATGNYVDPSGKGQKNAFLKGTVYFRHGAKSEPGTTDDLRCVLEREVARVREQWLAGIHKVVTAPIGAKIGVLPLEVTLSGDDPGSSTAVRLVNDEDAPALRAVRTDQLYPHRQKELLKRVNSMLANLTTVTGYDISCVRRAHNVDANPNFFYQPQYSSPQYSEEFATWIVGAYRSDNEFFSLARQKRRSTEQP